MKQSLDSGGTKGGYQRAAKRRVGGAGRMRRPGKSNESWRDGSRVGGNELSREIRKTKIKIGARKWRKGKSKSSYVRPNPKKKSVDMPNSSNDTKWGLTHRYIKYNQV